MGCDELAHDFGDSEGQKRLLGLAGRSLWLPHLCLTKGIALMRIARGCFWHWTSAVKQMMSLRFSARIMEWKRATFHCLLELTDGSGSRAVEIECGNEIHLFCTPVTKVGKRWQSHANKVTQTDISCYQSAAHANSPAAIPMPPLRALEGWPGRDGPPRRSSLPPQTPTKPYSDQSILKIELKGTLCR